MGTLSLSLEVELGWGQVLNEPATRFENLSAPERTVETQALDALLDACDQTGIPMTFDVVGHLLLDQCDGDHDSPHEDGWFDFDPGTDVDTDPLFYAPDLVEEIADAKTDHEICTHTFSHIPCDDVHPDVVDWELDQSRRLHESFGLDRPRSIVTPWHRDPPIDVLLDNGIDVMRVPDDEFDLEWSILTKLYWYLFRDPWTAHPDVENGMHYVYTTNGPSLTAPYLNAGQKSPHIAFRAIPESARARLHRRYLDAVLETVSETDEHVHLWSHLYDLGDPLQRRLVVDFLNHVGEAQRAGKVTVEPMCDIATK
jgi:peptidoglycan/xylan/chitin deacetylase (PgdA/CDA1 family)